jgi:hypothetical protein
MKTVKFPEKSVVTDKKREAIKDRVRKKVAAQQPRRVDIPLGPTPEPQPMQQLQQLLQPK